MLIQDTRAIVSGGASGLGLAVAQLVVAAGGRVALFDVNDQAGVEAVQNLGTAASFHKVDVTAESAVASAVAAATAAMGGLNLAVSCAGVGWPKRMVGKEGTMPGDFFRKVIEINLVGTLLLCKEAAAAMQRNAPNAEGERGALVMTASVAAFDGQIGQVAYAASKGGVVGMTLPMARELASSGIRVVTIAPGLFMTPMLAALPQEARDSLGLQVPFPPRLGRPAEYAQLVRQIVENPMLNGETIRLDGAIRMAPR
ncbi:MAG: SDR family NAD(P)-dependent oxidoreductase [Gammaproteobacteria bacterium]|nr:SDR family NAD(P)-dependent oxidoreductase [Gammaproteobacteria bacterium]MDH5273700.1 SDR family NAD(P)-dependent oxidoreductase [Gammaproteobacteria bacterium]